MVQGMGHGAADLGPSIFIGLQQSLCFILRKGYCLAQVEGHRIGMCLSLCQHRGSYPIGSEDEHRPLCPGQGATGSLYLKTYLVAASFTSIILVNGHVPVHQTLCGLFLSSGPDDRSSPANLPLHL